MILLLGLFSTTYGQEVTTDQSVEKIESEKFIVYGNCGMCKKTIEGALKDENGISEAIWDMDSGEMKVTFDAESVSIDDIKQKIADVGYDSDTHRAKVDVYNSLPGCCQYDRPE
jgi:mercuric ion binding protein